MVALGQALVMEGLQVGGEVLYLLCIQVLHTHTHTRTHTQRERGERVIVILGCACTYSMFHVLKG